MATMPNVNGKVDPFQALAGYIQNQNKQRSDVELREFNRELSTEKNATALARSEMANNPDNVYAKTAARLRARIDNGFGPKTGAEKNYSGSKAATEFRRGLAESGVTNPYAIASLMGHAQVESAGFNPRAIGDTNLGAGREAHGMLQWREDRWDALRSFAALNGKTPDDPYIQGKFAAYELTQGAEKQHGTRILNAKSLDEANAGMLAYLRPKNWNTANPHGGTQRFAASESWLRKGTGEKVANASPTTTVSGRTRDENDPAHIYRDSDGRRYQITHMKPDQAGLLATSLDRTYGKGAGKNMIALDLTERLNEKNGSPAYKVYADNLKDDKAAATVSADNPKGQVLTPAPVPVPAAPAAVVSPTPGVDPNVKALVEEELENGLVDNEEEEGQS